MSYEIIKSIQIRDNKVFLKSSSNNVYPKYYNEWECKTLSDILQSDGMDSLNYELLKEYENGNFQEGNPNKWSKAIERLRKTEEYSLYNWRNSNYDSNCPIQQARNSEGYKQMLLKSLELKEHKTKYIVSKKIYEMDYYVSRITSKSIKSTTDKSKAKIFKYKQDAERLLSINENFTIQQIL